MTSFKMAAMAGPKSLGRALVYASYGAPEAVLRYAVSTHRERERERDGVDVGRKRAGIGED